VNSWLELEQRFRNLAPTLQHSRLDAQWGAAGEYWRLAGTGVTPATHEYEILSTVAGKLLEKVLRPTEETEKALLGITDARTRWYNLLKSQSPFFGDRSYGEQVHEDGSSAGFIYTGSVRCPAEAAATLCLSLHTSHPVVERKSKWQWLHENYIKAIIVGLVIALVGAAAKFLVG